MTYNFTYHHIINMMTISDYMCVHAFQSAVTLTCTLSYYIDIFDTYFSLSAKTVKMKMNRGE